MKILFIFGECQHRDSIMSMNFFVVHDFSMSRETLAQSNHVYGVNFRNEKYVDYWHNILPEANISGAENEKNLGKRSIGSGQISRTS